MEKHHVTHLETQIKDLHRTMAHLATDQPVEELLVFLHRPGWTTPAEVLFVTGIVESMLAQVRALTGLKQILLSGAAKVELNPQPLPPKEHATR